MAEDVCFILHDASLLKKIPRHLLVRIRTINPDELCELVQIKLSGDMAVEIWIPDAKGIQILIWMLEQGYDVCVYVYVDLDRALNGVNYIRIQVLQVCDTSIIQNAVKHLVRDSERIFFLTRRTSHPKVLRALEHVCCNISDNISLTSVANQLGVTPNHLGRLFKQELDIGFVEFLNRSRIKMSIRLLNKGISITDAMEASGFNNQQHFYKQFKKYTSCTPRTMLVGDNAGFVE